MTPFLDVRDLGYTYPDGTQALAGISFSAAEGECVGIVGPNGAGKTTLVMLLAGLLNASGGGIRLGGAELNDRNLAMIRSRAAFVFHNPDDQLFMPTVLEDVCFGPLSAGREAAATERAAREILADLGLGGLERKFPGHLSAGQKRLATLAGVLIMKPQLLVLDEPSGTLDPRARRHLIEKLAALPQARLIISHDLEMIVELCTRAIVLDRGRVAADGPAAEILGDDNLMRAHSLEKPHILRHRHPH